MNKITNFIKTKKKLLIIMLFIILIVIIGMVTYNKIEEHTLTEDEKMIASVVKKLKDSAKNPESFQVFEIIYSKSSEDMSATVIVDCAAQNGYGGFNRTRHMYLTKADGTLTYWGSDDKANKSITKNTSINEQLEIAAANVVKEYWTKREGYVVADKDKILKNLDQAN